MILSSSFTTRLLAWRLTLKTTPKYDPLVLNCVPQVNRSPPTLSFLYVHSQATDQTKHGRAGVHGQWPHVMQDVQPRQGSTLNGHGDSRAEAALAVAQPVIRASHGLAAAQSVRQPRTGSRRSSRLIQSRCITQMLLNVRNLARCCPHQPLL